MDILSGGIFCLTTEWVSQHVLFACLPAITAKVNLNADNLSLSFPGIAAKTRKSLIIALQMPL
ncbi:MAG: hypothetical protein R3D32_11995 [Nitratireductor sp.]